MTENEAEVLSLLDIARHHFFIDRIDRTQYLQILLAGLKKIVKIKKIAEEI